MRLLFACLLMGSSLASAYVRLQDGAVFEHPVDSTNIEFYLNTLAAPGLKNADGATWIAADADVAGAVNGALGAWNSVSTANVHFAAVQPTASLDGTAGMNVIAFDDTPENRLLTAGAAAVTVRILALPDLTGVFLKTDIIFNPTEGFSTNLAAGTYDLQAVLTHELGHALGADHSGALCATMFQASAPATNNRAQLSADDIAFVSAAYPRSGSGAGLAADGTIAGVLTDQNGNILHGALISAEDPVSGVMVGGFSSPEDGTFSFQLPAGAYRLWAEPLTGMVQAADLYLPTDEPVDTQFQPALSPSLVNVAAGSISQVTLAATAGASPIAIQYAGAVPPHTGTFNIYAGPAAIPSGEDVPFVIQATGLSSDFGDADVTLVGPVTLVPGSVVSLGNSQYELTLHVPSAPSTTSASIVLDYHGNTAAFSGGLIIEPAIPAFPANGVGNVFSYASQAVAPGEIVAIFGTNLGPAAGMSGSFDPNGNLPASAGGIQVTFNGHAAPIFYASAGQVNVEVPFEIAGAASASVVISNGSVASQSVEIPVQASVPGLLGSAINPDGSLNTASNPVAGGQYVILYASGLGMKTAAVVTGGEVVGAQPSAAAVTASINGQPYTPEYAGAAPDFTGLDQINLSIPASLPSGKAMLSVEVNGQTSQSIAVWVR